MKSRSTFLNLGAVALLLTIQPQDNVQALKTGLKARATQQIAANIQALSTSLSEALSQNGAYSEAFSESEIQTLLESQVQNMIEKSKKGKQEESEKEAVSITLLFQNSAISRNDFLDK